MKSTSTPDDFPPVLAPVCRTLDDKKAADIRIFCVRAQSSITDYLVLGTATSEPHLRALRVELEKTIDAAKVRIVGMDTTQGSGWIVVDAFDVMVHVFTEENRRKYALENLWKDAEEVGLIDVLSGPKPKSKPKRKAPAKKAAQPAAAPKKPKAKAAAAPRKRKPAKE